MGKFAPVFLAFLLNSFGINIFRETKPGCEPLVSCLIFLLSVFILLWDMKLYPSSLRKLSKHGTFVLEFLLSAFIMENIMNDFWFPLEESLSILLPKISETEKDLLKQGGWDCSGLFSFLSWDGTIVIASYLLSLFFLIGVLHATRAIDFRILTDCGFGAFLKDIFQKFKKYKRKILKLCSKKKCVKFKSDSRAGSCAKSLFSSCPTEFDCNENFSDSDEDELCCNNHNKGGLSSYCCRKYK